MGGPFAGTQPSDWQPPGSGDIVVDDLDNDINRICTGIWATGDHSNPM